MELSEDAFEILESDLYRVVFPIGEIEYDPLVKASEDEQTVEEQERLLNVEEEEEDTEPSQATTTKSSMIMLMLATVYGFLVNL